MKENIIIRLERENEYHEVENLVRESFWNVYRPGCLEHYVLRQLRNDPAFVPELDFVMTLDGQLIGQNMFMKAVIVADDGRSIPIMTMGPICIAPELKRKGYGKILLDYSLEKAKELGCNKIALGHHFDDVIETILMGMLYGGQVQTMMPKLHSIHFEGMELIRPLYLIREEDIKHWRDYNSLHFIQCACRFTDTCTTCRPNGESASKRMEIKHMIAEMKKVNPYVETNIFRSIENVNLDTVVAYKKNGVRHSFLEDYESC